MEFTFLFKGLKKYHIFYCLELKRMVYLFGKSVKTTVIAMSKKAKATGFKSRDERIKSE